MAILIPQKIRAFSEESMENIMFESLSKLPSGNDNYDSYYVFHSFSIETESEQSGLNVYETDFLVFHPKKGIICIEGKAGDIYHDRGEWYYAKSKRPMSYGGPFIQARNSKYRLKEYIRNREESLIETGHLPKGKLLSERYPVYHAVWLPSMSRGKIRNMVFPSDCYMEKDFILTSNDLENPLERIEKIFSSHISEVSYSKESTDILLSRVLCSYADILMTSNFSLKEHNAIFYSMLEEQKTVLKLLRDQHSAAIKGAGGTGKTLLAASYAKSIANEDNKVLFMCFNKMLRDDLEYRYRDENITFKTVTELACEYVNCGYDYEDKYDKCLEIIDEMIDNGEFPYRHIVIDEGQDFGIGDIENSDLLDYLKRYVEKVNGTFYIFYDKNQLVHNSILPFVIDDCDSKITLYENCRNTDKIKRFTTRILDKSQNVVINDFSEPNPVMYFAKDENKIRDCVNKAIKNATDMLGVSDEQMYKNIVILTTKSYRRSGFTRFTEEDDNHDKRYYTYHYGKDKSVDILFTTARKFKGMESNAVIIIDIERENFDDDNKLVYVAASRAKLLLYMVVNNMDNEQIEEVVYKFDGDITSRNLQKEMAKSLYCDIG